MGGERGERACVRIDGWNEYGNSSSLRSSLSLTFARNFQRQFVHVPVAVANAIDLLRPVQNYNVDVRSVEIAVAGGH